MSAATVGGLAAAGIGAAASSGAFSPGSPSQVNYGAATAAEEQAQINLLPASTAAAATYDPQIAAIQQGVNWNNLFGTAAGNREVTNSVPTAGFINTQTGQFVAGSTNPGGPANVGWQNRTGTPTPNAWIPTTQNVTSTQNIPVAATPGTLQMAQTALPVIDQMSAQANTDQRTANIADVQNLGPQALAALRAFNPAQTNLEDSLTAQAQQQLNAGSSLTPAMQQEDEQYVRQGQSARGLGYGPTDAYTEAFTLGQAGQNLLAQREATAGNVVNQNSQLYGDPFLAITGQSSGRNTSPTQFAGTGAPSPTMSDITGGQNAALTVATNNNNLTNQANIAEYNSQMAGIGALAKTNWGSLFGGTSSLFGSGTTPNSGSAAQMINSDGSIGTEFDEDLG